MKNFQLMTRLLPGSARFLVLPFFFLLVLFVFGSAAAQDVAGEWKGTIKIPGGGLGITVVLKQGASWSGTYDIPAQNIKAFPLEKITVALPNVSFRLGGGIPGEPAFSLQLSADGTRMEGEFSQGGMSFPAVLDREGEGGKGKEETTEAARLQEIKTFVADMKEKWGIPGMAVAVVKGDKVVMAEGFGERDVENNLPVTPSTLFAIGSTTKAFTSVIIGTLVDEGKLKWDEPVATYLPDFRLQDEYATTHLTVRDLLTHLSGLPRHDLLWYGADFSRRELYNRLRFLEPTAQLREKWQYQNLMFMTAGVLAERVSGKSWEDLVRERIFAPLGMVRATLSVADMKKDKDFSLPYTKEEGKIKSVDFRTLDAVAPAGGINAGVDEMAAWLRLNLNGGEFEGKRVISEESLHEIHDPHVVISGETGVEGLDFNLYAMGWMVSSYREHRLVHHGGGIDGFVSHVALLPDDGIGIVVLTNRPTGLPEILTLDIADRILGLKPLNHTKGMLGSADPAESEGPTVEAGDVARIKGTKPSYSLAEYEGAYDHPAYGQVKILRRGESLSAVYHGDTLALEHYHYDVFQVTSNKLLLAFQPNVSGGVAALTVTLEPAVSPIRFEKAAPERLHDPGYLKRFQGNYILSGQTAKVGIRDSALTLLVPGQPLYTLIPYREKPGAFTEFTIVGLQGFSVRFEEEKGEVRRGVFLQPNGTFVAEKE